MFRREFVRDGGCEITITDNDRFVPQTGTWSGLTASVISKYSMLFFSLHVLFDCSR